MVPNYFDEAVFNIQYVIKSRHKVMSKGLIKWGIEIIREEGTPRWDT